MPYPYVSINKCCDNRLQSLPSAVRNPTEKRCSRSTKKGLNPMIQPLFLGARIFRIVETTPLRSALRLFIPQSTMQIYICHLYSPAYIPPYNLRIFHRV